MFASTVVANNIPLLLALLVALIASSCNAADAVPPGIAAKTAKQTATLPPCRLCRTLTDSFVRGMERTARSKHDGGDAAWEEQRLGSYKRSELRLIEIQERLCGDVQRGEDQCHAFAETNEPLLEEWWTQHQDERADLHAWLCVDRLQLCCAAGTFGPRCEPCEPCGGNGKCKGDGTRKGNGQCDCDAGYKGVRCGECSNRYYESYRDAEKLLCSECHAACGADAGCTQAGPKGCRVCKAGWMMRPEQGGCVDVDECASTTTERAATCTRNQFCVNNEGSYSCLECDRSCNGCRGDGPDECLECGAGYELRDGLCKDLSGERREQYSTYMRYFTYLGLCVATCVVLQNSVYAASAIGLAVAAYISLAEYYLYLNPAPAGQQDNAVGQQQADYVLNADELVAP